MPVPRVTSAVAVVLTWVCAAAAEPPAVAPPPRVAGDPPPGVFAVLGSARFRTPHASWYPCFTPGGSAVVSVGSGEVRVTDARTGRPRWRADLPGDELDGHQLPLPQVGPDGGVAVLVAGQQAGRVDRFDPAGRPLGRVDFPRLDAPHVWALSGDGRRAVAASALTPGKAVLRVFDARTGKPAATHHPADVRGPFGQAVLSADGRRVAIGDNDTARVFDTDTGAVVDAWEMPGQHPIELTFTPDGGRVIAVRHGSPPAAVVRDLVAKRGVALPPVYLWWRAVGPDGRTLAGPDGQGGIGVWDLGSGRLVRRFGGGWNTRVGALSPDGRTLVTAGDYGAFTLWDAAAGDRLPESADPAEGVSELRFVGDRAVAARLGARPFTFGWAAWDVRTGRSAARPTGPDNWGQGDLSPDGRRVVQTGPLRVVDRDAGREVWRDGAKDEGTSPHMVRFTPDGRRLVLRFGQSIEFRDADTGLTEKTIPAPNGGRLFGLSPDGRYALVDQLLPRDGDTPMPGEGLAAVDLTTGETATTFGDDTLGAGSAAAVSPDGRRVGYAVCRYETRSTGPRSWSHSLVAAKLVVREVGTWREVGRFDCPPAGTWASAPAFSPDGRRVALAEADGASIRDADTGRVVREFPLGGPATALTFSPDGTTLATAANGTAVYLWDLSGTRTGPAAEFREPHPTAAAVRAAAAALTTADPEAATEALRVLHADPAAAVAAIRAAVKPVVVPDPGTVARWIADLGADEFADRERAEKELTRRATTLAPTVRAARTANPTTEQARRMDRILAAAEQPTPDDRAGVRAVGVLARVGTPEAVAVLRELAAGAAGAEPTRAAAEALKHLGR